MPGTTGASIEIANLCGNRLRKDWDLRPDEMQCLLGMNEQEYLDLLAEAYGFENEKVNQRLACIIQIREILFSVFRDHYIERLWLKGSRKELDNRSPMDLMLDPDPKEIVRALEFVQITANR